MGCANSKQTRCRNCQSQYSPAPRSYSMHVHHPPQAEGDSYHVVALTSSTLGSLKMGSSKQSNSIHNDNDNDDDINMDTFEGHVIEERKLKDFSMELIEAKTWSSMINDKIPKLAPKTPTMTPPGEPEMINSWELMEGLEDISPLRPNHLRSFSFDVTPNSISMNIDRSKSRFQENGASPKPMWLEMGNDDLKNSNLISKTIVSDFDPDIISTFRKALEELSPKSPFEKESPVSVKNEAKVFPLCGGGDDDKVVVYFTSLRGVRKTYEDCSHVRVILKGLGVRVDERDVSMHSGFKEELRERLGDGFNGGGLPRAFLGEKYLGGAEEIRKMHEDGELEKALQGCIMVNDGGDRGGVCEACGDVRFVPCERCSGSCKIYYEGSNYDDNDNDNDDSDYGHDRECENDDEGKDDEENNEENEYGFQRCPDCNENGIVRCPVCCY